MINNTVWGDNYPEIQGNGLELYKLLVEQEVMRLGKEMNEENFTTVGKDAIRFLELAINNTEGQIIDRPNLDALYNRVRIFHHYFSAYRKNLLTEIPLREIPNRHIIKFIMKEYDKSPIPKPQTLEEAGIEAFKIGIANFLQSAEGQHFLTSSYARNFVNPGKLIPNSQARSYWAFILLYWRYKNYWNKDHPLEQASTSNILEFLTQYYKQYWQEEISAQLSIRELGVHQVFSIFSTEQTIPTNAYKHSINTTYDNRILQDFTEFITPPRKTATNSGPPPLNKIRRIMDKNNLASLDPSSPNYLDYSPPTTPSRTPLKMRNTGAGHQLCHPNKSAIQIPPDSVNYIKNPKDESTQDDSNKENIPLQRVKQERKPERTPPEFKVIGRDNRSIKTADKSTDCSCAASQSSQISRNNFADETRPDTRTPIIRKNNTVRKLYLSTQKIRESPTDSTMSNQVGGTHPEPIIHPHFDIGSSHLLRNSLFNAKLRPMSLTITLPNAHITEFSHNPNLPNPFFAKVYLPYTMLTGYWDSHIQTAEACVYLCLHFNGNDPQIFGLASLSTNIHELFTNISWTFKNYIM